jgi:hypothetical protein
MLSYVYDLTILDGAQNRSGAAWVWRVRDGRKCRRRRCRICPNPGYTVSWNRFR